MNHFGKVILLYIYKTNSELVLVNHFSKVILLYICVFFQIFFPLHKVIRRY